MSSFGPMTCNDPAAEWTDDCGCFWWKSEEFVQQQRRGWEEWAATDEDAVSTFVSSNIAIASSVSSSDLDFQCDVIAPVVELFDVKLSRELMELAARKAVEAQGHATTQGVQTWVLTNPAVNGVALACQLDILAAATCKNANYVVQLLARVIPGDYLSILGQVVGCNFGFLARSEYGCRLIQRLLERSDCILVSRFIADLCLDEGLDKLIWDRWGAFVAGVFLETRSRDELYELQPVIANLIRGCHGRFDEDTVGTNVRSKKIFGLNYGTYAVVQILQNNVDFLPNLCRERVKFLLKRRRNVQRSNTNVSVCIPPEYSSTLSEALVSQPCKKHRGGKSKRGIRSRPTNGLDYRTWRSMRRGAGAPGY